MEFIKALARRIEGQIRNDAVALPIVRSAVYKWTIEHMPDIIVPYQGDRNRPASVVTNELVKAAKVLADTLHTGTVTLKSGKKIPIAGAVSYTHLTLPTTPYV